MLELGAWLAESVEKRERYKYKERANRTIWCRKPGSSSLPVVTRRDGAFERPDDERVPIGAAPRDIRAVALHNWRQLLGTIPAASNMTGGAAH